MSIRELREETKRIFKEAGVHPYITLIGLYLLVYVFNFIVQAIIVAVGGNKMSALSVVLFGAAYIAIFVFSLWAALSLGWYYMRMTRGERAKDSFKMAFHSLPGFICYSLIYSVGCGIAVIFLPLVIIMFLSAINANTAFIVIFAAVMLIGLIYISIVFSLSPFCYYDRGEKTIIQTVISNFKVTKYHKLGIFKVMLAYCIPMLVMYAIAIGCFVYLAMVIQSQTSIKPYTIVFALIMLAAFIGTAVYMIWMIPNLLTNLCIIYNDITGFTAENTEESNIEATTSADLQ